MNATPSETICKCGRLYSHCHFCGSINLYPMQKRSLSRTIEIGRDITVYRCKKCGRETDDAMECNAGPESCNTDFRPYQKPEAQKPWGVLLAGSPEYLNLFNQTAYEMVQKKKKKNVTNMNEACAELIRQGWPLTEEDVSDDLASYLKSKGLFANKDEQTKEDNSMRGASDTQSPPSSEASLEDIIKAMNEEQK